MTTMAATPSMTASTVVAPRFLDIVRSEWIKLASLGSTWFALVGMMVIGFGGGFATAFRPMMSSIPLEPDVARTMYDITMVSGAICPVFAGILGVLAIGNEYTAGTIQSTLLASPTRLRALWAKALILFGITAIASAVMVFGAWGASYPIFSKFGYEAPLSAPGVPGSLLGVVGYLAMTSVFGLGVGAIFRSNTIGVIIVFTTCFLGPGLSTILPGGLLSTVARMLMIGNGGYGMTQIAPEGAPFANLHGFLSPMAGTLLVLAWMTTALGLGAFLLRKRDA